MRILHTSDWHLGKRLFKLDRAPEHALFLDWLVKLIQTEEIDVLLLAGDVFDTPTPPHQSLEMFYGFLHRLSIETKAHTYIIAGNHDSGLLIEAPRELLKSHRVKVWGKLSPHPSDHWITLSANGQSAHLCAIPFFRSHEILPQGEGDALEAFSRYLQFSSKGPHLLMLHHLAGMFEAAGSEQVISLSGVDSIPAELLNKFDYVALGHIHKPQRIASQSYYSGSPLPLRFSETVQKTLNLIEFENDKMQVRPLPIPLWRPLITMKVTEENWKEKIQSLEISSPLTPQVEIQMTMSSPRTGLIDEIKTELTKKNTELLSYLPEFRGQDKKESKNTKLHELSTKDLFVEFFRSKYPEAQEPPSELMDDFSKLLEKVKYATHPSQDS
jgi:DNA repair protein SbcD/Mre11